MTTSRHTAVSVRGFTLMEMLFAVAASAMLLLAIHLVFYGALRLRNKTAQAVEEAVPLQHTLAIIKRDLMNLVAPSSSNGIFFGPLQTETTASSSSSGSSTSSGSTSSGQTGGVQSGGNQAGGAMDLGGQTASGLAGQQVSPTLYTATGAIDQTSPWAEIQKVTYFLVDPTNSTPGKDLLRSVTRNFLPIMQEESDDQWLMGGVEDVVFLFYDGMQWIDTWDSTSSETNLPMAIKVQIELTAKETELERRTPIELIVPIVVQSRTNSAAQTEELLF
jgi:prepilin-type N-terminal cleavage/methylation domain-containing protein